MKLKVLPANGEDGIFPAHCQSLKSCWTQGKTKKSYDIRKDHQSINISLNENILKHPTFSPFFSK